MKMSWSGSNCIITSGFKNNDHICIGNKSDCIGFRPFEETGYKAEVKIENYFDGSISYNSYNKTITVDVSHNKVVIKNKEKEYDFLKLLEKIEELEKRLSIVECAPGGVEYLKALEEEKDSGLLAEN